MIAAPALANASTTSSPSVALIVFLGGHEEGRVAVGGTPVRAIEADEVIDPEGVEHRGHPAPARPEPPEVVGAHRVPQVDGQAPILACLGERVGRRADAGLSREEGLVRPHVGAVGAHHERQIADQRDAVEVATGLLPLALRDPLRPADLEDRLGMRGACLRDGLDVARRQSGRPLPPRARRVVVVQRAEERVVVEPPALLGDVGLQVPGPRRVSRPLRREEVRERATRAWRP